jgi:hypothetical protein
MTQLVYPIVGSSFHPPASLILKELSVGTPLSLRAEPTNPHDPNAIAVWMEWSDVKVSTIDRLLDNEEVRKSYWRDGQIQLGYLPRAVAAKLAENGFPVDQPIHCFFHLTPTTDASHIRVDTGQWDKASAK